MDLHISFFVILAAFGIIALASHSLGHFLARRANLPLISGFLIAGIIVGPYGLGLVTETAVQNLKLVDELSLAVIAFAAGSELFVEELRHRVRSISLITLGNAIAVPLLGVIAVMLLAPIIPFMDGLSLTGRFAVAVLAGSILVARSPSSAIAIVNEMRAKGAFTQTVLGVTMVTDVVVIVLFAINVEMADALLSGIGLNLNFVLLLIGELLMTLLLGLLLGLLLRLFLSFKTGEGFKILLILSAGLMIFTFTSWLREYSGEHTPVELLLEPLLICLIGSFYVTNFTKYRTEFMKILGDLGPPIYVLFFTLTGASLALDVLIDTWDVALILFGVRLLGIFVGSLGGGVAARDPKPHNRYGWMTYVTMAGVGLGLAKEVADQFPEFGIEFATILIAVIVMSQLIGPPLFKNAITRVGEAHPKHKTPQFDGVRDAVIFGLTPQSVSLAKQLLAHDWQVKLLCLSPEKMAGFTEPDLDIIYLPELSVAALREIGMEAADAAVLMRSDEQNYEVCELLYEHFGTETMVARLQDRANFDKFHALGVLVVEPQTAVVSLLDHFVRAPAGTSLLLGMQETQDIVDVEMRNPDLDGLTLRDLRLPLDVLILSVQRNGERIISHGYTKLEIGDKVTMVGDRKKLEEVMLHFDA
jgi:Trk K+ transport system NAD-binding subunit/Kef-type K+ transport system membrane component KefB